MDISLDHQHHLIALLGDLLLFFAISGLAVPLLQRIKLSPVLGYLMCGIVIGPYGLGLFVGELPLVEYLSIDDLNAAHLLGELGIIALMFMIGLELSFSRLRELKKYVLGLGSLQIILCTAVIALIAAQFENSIDASLLVGASLALSSTAIVMQLLDEQHLSNRPLGILCFSILLMQDLAVVPILVLASVLAGGEGQSVWLMALHSLMIAVIAVTTIYVIGKRVMRPLMNYLSFTRSPACLTAFVLFMVIAAATLTQSSGLSAALGAFLAGLLLAETEFRHEIEIIFEPLKSLLLGIFFLSIGMMIDLREIASNPYWIAGSVIGIMAIKIAVIYPLARAFGVARNPAAQVAVVLAHAGEFAFLILSVSLVYKLVPAADAQFFLLVAAVSMFVAPLSFKLAPIIAGQVCRLSGDLDNQSGQTDGLSGHVLIAGFGRVGFMVGSILERQHVPYIALDRDPERVRVFQKKGYNVVYGDVARIEQWRKMNPEEARCMIIAIDESDVAEQILKTVRKHWPGLPIMMRSKDLGAVKNLYDIGAKLVVPETLELSLKLAEAALHTAGVAHDELQEVIASNRRLVMLPEE